ncbi:protein of unknown function [Blastococcus saxobsidens DD2]|uniref:Uncharacterized protein n=1 Tax=Blastococcus saxobsidens (strain DD2) TaxID=1146883 RepID=H6RK28_BLASD|nr:protein of unknown function [Blastococcus saxobsidens DD2]
MGRSRGPEGSRPGHRQRLSAAGGRHLVAVWVGRGARRAPDRDTGSGSARQGDGTWWRCRPEADHVRARRRTR